MERFVLVARPHGNIRQHLWRLKREAFDWNRDDVSMALPEGYICGWFVSSEFSADLLSKNAFSEHAQQVLSRQADSICSALPDTFHFSSVMKENGHSILRLDDELDLSRLKVSLESFARDTGLEPCHDVPAPYGEALKGIWLGSGDTTPTPPPLSFKKYELVLYLTELPETPFGGFQFITVARVHRKVKARPRMEGE